MSAPPYMPLYVADYLGDTTHLTTVEHGAYLLLLMAMWRAGGKLPLEAEKLARFAKLTPAKWAILEAVVLALFDVQPDHIGHKRLQREFEKYTKTAHKRALSGAMGSKAKSLKNKNLDLANGSANAKPGLSNQNQNHISEPEEEDKKPPVSPNGLTAPKGARTPKPKTVKKTICPEDWEPTESHWAKAAKLELPEDFVRIEIEKFREWEFGVGKTNFDLAFHRWLRMAAKRLTESTNGGGSIPADRAGRDLDRRLATLRPMALGAQEALDRGRRRRWAV